MKVQIIALALAAAFITTGAQAMTRTIGFTADIAASSDPNFFTMLGIAPVTTVTGSFSFDTGASPFDGPYTTTDGDSASFAYQSLSMTIGSVTLNADPTPHPGSGIWVFEGDTSFYYDRVLVSAVETYNPLSPHTQFGINLQFGIPGGSYDMKNAVNDFDDGLSFLAASLLENLGLGSGLNTISLRDLSDPSNQLTASASLALRSVYDVTAAVPLPAALPFLASGLALLGLLGWSRKRVRPHAASMGLAPTG